MNKTRYLKAKRALFDLRYDFLNDKQREAVFKTEGPLLVLAGAGSGKTTVLVNRIAFIIKYGDAYNNNYVPPQMSENEMQMLEETAENINNFTSDELDDILSMFAYNPVMPYSILSITFTNKAADEMKNRLIKVLGESAADIWAGTFHSICVRILRRNISKLGFDSNFTIYDTEDSKRQITDVMKSLNIDEKNLSARQAMNAVSRYKEKMQSPEDIKASQDIKEQQLKKIYEQYQKRLVLSNALDFDDIIFYTVRLLENNDDIRDYYNNKFKCISVDEFQDTNKAQYKLVSLLSEKHNNIMVVGDDDQSIYRFRGATIENILGFNTDITDAQTVKLEQNYRSTQKILNVANELIKKNIGRMGKNLWTKKDSDRQVVIKETYNQTEEASYIAETIANIKNNENKSFNDFAILYRQNVMAGGLEIMLNRNRIPYRVYGSIKFFERKEIKIMRAYLNLINNPADSASLKRVINEPSRKIGETTVRAIEDVAVTESKTMFEIIQNADKYTALTRSKAKLISFAEMIKNFSELKKTESLPDFIEKVYDNSGYRSLLEEGGNDDKERLEHVKEFISQAMQFYMENAAEEVGEESMLQMFLEKISLSSDMDTYDENSGAVTLMTIHSSKGLEFPIVFIAGVEEGVFPSMMSVNEGDEGIEEERRLAYVAVTRAKDMLYLTYTKERFMYSRTTNNPVSRFIEEIPVSLYNHIPLPKNEDARYQSYQKKNPPKIPGNGEFTTAYTTASESKKESYVQLFKTGDTVVHASYGKGLVVKTVDLSGDTLYEVAFDSVGTKRMMGTYNKLKKL